MIEQMFALSDTDCQTERETAAKHIPPRKPPYARSDTKRDVPDPQSARISWWPQEAAPARLVKMIDRLWTVRDTRVRWWFGICAAGPHPDGFPRFINYMRQVRVGDYWYGLAFQKEHAHYEVSDLTKEELSELEAAA